MVLVRYAAHKVLVIQHTLKLPDIPLRHDMKDNGKIRGNTKECVQFTYVCMYVCMHACMHASMHA